MRWIAICESKGWGATRVASKYCWGLTMSRRTIAVFALLCLSIASDAAERPTVLNPIKGHRAELDLLVHEHLDKLYEVKDIDVTGHVYRNPKGIGGFGATAPVYVEGHCISGNVVVVYVITLEGSVGSVYAATATDPVLSKVAVQSMAKRRFEPAQLDGKPVSTTAASPFVFRCPA